MRATVVTIQVDMRLAKLWVAAMALAAPAIGARRAWWLAELGAWRLARFRLVGGPWQRFATLP